MKIRTARASDAQAIARNNVLLAKESENELLDNPTALSGVRAVISDRKKGFYIVATDGGELAGELMVTFEWSDWRNRMMWWIQSVYVARKWRRSGVFSLLFLEIVRRARRAGASIVRLYAYSGNRKARKVYARVGMVEKPYIIYQFNP